MLHLVYSTKRPIVPAELLERLRVPAAQRARTVLDQTAGDPVSALLEAKTRRDVKLVVMSPPGEAVSHALESTGRLGPVARALIEQSTVPIVMAPPNYREALPWRSMLIASDGQPAADEAVVMAVRLGAILGLKMTVAHVIVEGPQARVLGQYADAPQHELLGRVEQIVKRAMMELSPAERRCIEEPMNLRVGDPVTELLAEVDRHRSSVLALGWHGTLDPTRATVLQSLVERAECPLLLVRKTERSRLRLNVGDAISGS
jgi:nucleotide-binding universal stress UspA family protein